ncbi:MAG: ROK family protein [Candidatus Paceibacterota bacterium]
MYLLFDIGGTNTRVAFSKDGKDIGEPVVFPTPQDFEEAMKAMKKALVDLGVAVGSFKIACGGVPGVFDKVAGSLTFSPNLPDWVGKALREKLFQSFGVPVHIENDASLVGLGEAHYGAGKGFSIVEYITVSTGVGGARIVDGKIDEKSVGFEPGQEVMTFGAENVGTSSGEKTTFENAVSGTALEKRFGKKPKEVTDPQVWEELAEKLAFGLHNTIVLWSPDVLVLGGSMIVGDPAISVERTDFYLQKMLKIFPKPPILKKAELGALGGLWGALEFAKSKS